MTWGRNGSDLVFYRLGALRADMGIGPYEFLG